MHEPMKPVAPAGRGRLLKTAVYAAVAIIAVLVVLAARGFSRDVGDAHLAGRFLFLPLARSRTPAQLALTWNGLTLHFSRGGNPSLQGFQSEGAATDIVFDDGSRLRLLPGSDAGGSLSLTPVGAASGAGAATVVVRFTLQGVLQEPPPAGAALAWKHAGRSFLLSLPAGGESDPEAGMLTLPLAGSAPAVLQAQGVAPVTGTAPSATTSLSAARVPREEDMPAADRMQAAVSSFLDAAWRGWSSTRYSASDGTWRLADGTRGFSEDLGVGLLSQSVARGTWQTALAQWSDALARRQKRGTPASLTYVTSAYVGGVRDFAAALQQTSRAGAAQVQDLLQRSDASVLRLSGLVPLLVDHGSADLLQRAGRFLATRSSAGLDEDSALGLGADLLDYRTLVSADESMLRLLTDVVQKRILPAVRATDSGVFLDSGDGTSDLRTDVLAGALLLRAGPAIGSSLASAVGRGLLVSSLALSDEEGFLPAVLTIRGGRLRDREGTVSPESIYPLLPSVPFVPREIPLASQMGDGSWVWTSARLVSAAGASPGMTLLFSYPRGIPYHMVIHGVRPFSLLKLHGIPWHSDPAYFKYSDGWEYDRSSQTLFMKVTGRVDPEEIDITY